MKPVFWLYSFLVFYVERQGGRLIEAFTKHYHMEGWSWSLVKVIGGPPLKVLGAAKTSLSNQGPLKSFQSVSPLESFTQFTEVHADTVLTFQKLQYNHCYRSFVVQLWNKWQKLEKGQFQWHGLHGDTQTNKPLNHDGWMVRETA